MKTYNVRYESREGGIDEIEVEIEDYEDENDAMEAAREELTSKHPSVDTDEWEIHGAIEIVPEIECVRVYKYDPDIPAECWEVEIGDETLQILAERDGDGSISVSISHGYQEGSAPYRHEAELFTRHEAAIRQGAEKAIVDMEAEAAPTSLPRP